jgi:hypothetical protein
LPSLWAQNAWLDEPLIRLWMRALDLSAEISPMV